MPQNEAELLAEASRGDQSAFTALYYMYETDLYRFVYYLAGGPETAEELFQETWVRVVRHLGRKPVTNFRKWLFVIATNLYRDELRKRKVRRLVLGRESIGEDYGDPESSPDPVTVPETRPATDSFVIREALGKAMDKLSHRQREVFVLTHIEGFRIQEVADILGKPQGTVKSTLHRAVLTLRNELREFRPGK
jgi:RNA polymerase sigma-70 factor (ECF subfamily)